MKMQRRTLNTWALSLTAASLMGIAVSAQAQGVIKIGEINSYKAQPAFLEPYKKGMELAVEQINAAGGVNGKKLELVIRDDNANPGDAVRAAEELISREKVDVLTGSFLSNIGLALTDFAKQKKFFFLAAEPLTDKIVWQNGNRYTFRLRASTYMQTAMLVPEAAAMKKKRWAIIYPNYEYGQSAAASFKALMKAAQPDVEFVAEQATPLGRIDSGSVVQAVADAKPDAIFNVLFGADLSKFVREGNTRGLFQGREVVSLLTGEPEYLDPLKEETFYSAHHEFAEMRGKCPVAHSQEFNGFWALLKYKDIVDVLENHENYITSVQNVVPKVAFTGRRPPLHLDPPEHTPYRQTINRFFTPKKVNALESEIREITINLLKPLK